VKQAPAVGFRYTVSRLLMSAMLVVTVLAIAAIWISAASLGLCMVLTACIAAYVGATLWRMLRPRLRSVLWRADGSVEMGFNDGATDGRGEVQGAVHAARVLGPLIVLTLRWPPGGRKSLWLLPDNLDAETRRRLRMRLGTSGSFASGNADSD
jgi:toxin CptA